jgi:hypothetical protein
MTNDMIERVAQALRSTLWQYGTQLTKSINEELARAAIEAMLGWQPIETAPKDGERILVARPFATINANMVGEDYWADRLQGGCWARSTPMAQPTHWMPLPEPPK